MRNLILRGGAWTDEQNWQILDYCESDVDAVLRLLPAMLDVAQYTEADFGRALLRGRYLVAAGAVENFGIPIDIDLLDRLKRHWGSIKLGLVLAIDTGFGVYEGSRSAKSIPWPRLLSGALCLDEETFRQQAQAHPEIAPLRELRHTLGQLRLNDFVVGPDGRNRTILSAFRAKTRRNQPSNSRFIFGPSVWLR